MYRFIAIYIFWLLISCLAYYDYLMSLQRFFGVPNREWTAHDYAFGLILANAAALLFAAITMLLIFLFKKIVSYIKSET